MSESSEDLVACMATEPWRPQSLRIRPGDPLGPRLRMGVLAGIVSLHLIGAWAFLELLAHDPPPEIETILVLDFSALPPVQPAPSPPTKPASRPPEKPVVRPKPRRLRRPPSALQSHPALQAQPSPPTARPTTATATASRELQLYNPDGSLRVPEDMLAQIDRQVGDQRTFSYQIPHMDDARKYFERNPALAYEKTRFDQYWTPDQDMLTELLTKLVEKTTKEIRIPVPGQPGSTMVCKVSLLALGGGCGVLTNGSDYVGPVDDPDTLSPEEDRQCAAWWNQIIGAKTQDVWRKTKSLYEQECRKPLARPH